MTSSSSRYPDRAVEEKVVRLEEENAQLQQALSSHAVVDQALGVLIAVHRLPAEEGWEVLREVSQHLNVKLHAVADEVIAWALGEAADRAVLGRLQAQVRKRRRHRPSADSEAAGARPCALDGSDSTSPK